MSHTSPSIVVIGATGYTGQLVARELKRAGRPFTIAGRNAARLDALAAELGGVRSRRVDVTSRASLDELLAEGDVVINCAGPFSQLGEPVVRACIDAGTHYLDTTGEQAFLRTVLSRYHEAALERGVSVAPGMAFEYALGDTAVALGAERLSLPLRSVDVIYAWDQPLSSRGTRRTVVRVLARRGVILDHGRLTRRALGSARRTVRIASGDEVQAVLFTSGEVITVPRHVAADSVRGWAVVGSGIARVLPLVAPAVPVVVTVLRPIIEAMATRRPDPDPEVAASNRFTIRVELHDRTGRRRALEIRGRNPYGLTATIVATGARRALEPDAPRGVLAPAELVHPRAFLAGLAGLGLRLVEDA
jgi:short subunit dehydrogenase-like uncharacterized protein